MNFYCKLIFERFCTRFTGEISFYSVKYHLMDRSLLLVLYSESDEMYRFNPLLDLILYFCGGSNTDDVIIKYQNPLLGCKISIDDGVVWPISMTFMVPTLSHLNYGPLLS